MPHYWSRRRTQHVRTSLNWWSTRQNTTSLIAMTCARSHECRVLLRCMQSMWRRCCAGWRRCSGGGGGVVIRVPIMHLLTERLCFAARQLERAETGVWWVVEGSENNSKYRRLLVCHKTQAMPCVSVHRRLWNIKRLALSPELHVHVHKNVISSSYLQ